MTPQTPMSGGLFSFPTRLDNTVFLTTDRLTFWLQVNNGGSSNPPTAPPRSGSSTTTPPRPHFYFTKAVKRLDLAVFDEDGTVLGTHQSVRLQCGPDFNEEEARDRVLAYAHDQAGREPGSLRVIAFERDGMPSSTDLRVDPSSGRVEPLGDPNTNPFRV